MWQEVFFYKVSKPLIYTDSEALKWMETADISGTVTGTEKGVLISFYA